MSLWVYKRVHNQDGVSLWVYTLCVCELSSNHPGLLTLRPVASKLSPLALFIATDTRFSSSDIRPIELLAPQLPLPTRPCSPDIPAVRLNHRLMENLL